MTTDHKNALPLGHQLHEYAIEAVLGGGGFGLTYRALDTHLKKPVAIKEYLPQDLAIRQGQTTLVAKSSADEEFYQWGLQRFLAEAQILAQFNHPNIVRVLRFIEAHNTAYLVMDFEQGETLGDYLEHHGPTLTEVEILDIFLPILDGLRAVHEASLLHRDIKPDNIFLRSDASPMLIDFGSARFALGEKSRSLSVVVSEGFAPHEQYTSRGKQGAWTDVYGIGASLYFCITGELPPAAPDRSTALTEDEPDPYHPLGPQALPGYSPELLVSVDHALQFRIKDRPPTARALQQRLTDTEAPAAEPEKSDPSASPKKPSTTHPAEPTEPLTTDNPESSPPTQEQPGSTRPLPSFNWPGLWLGIAAVIILTSLIGYINQSGGTDSASTPAPRVDIARTPQGQPGTVFRDRLSNGEQGPDMVVIPAGSFRMGDIQGDGGDDEEPMHPVTFAKPFALGRYEVTTAEYLKCVNAGGCAKPEWLEAEDKYNIHTGSSDYYKKFTDDQQPIIGVSWHDANSYTDWLSQQTGKAYRLPSEAEWEYAARAGSNTQYSWGNSIGRNQAVCTSCGSRWDHKSTAPVGSFSANAFGLYDMHGNVNEWVEDSWHSNYHGAPEDGSAWTTGGDRSRRILRGGSWVDHPGNLRAADRATTWPVGRNGSIGFRLARDL